MALFDYDELLKQDNIEINKLTPTYDTITAIAESMSVGFSTEYSYADIKKSFNIYTYYGILDDDKLSMVGIKFLDKSDEPDYIKKVIRKNKFIVISNLVSRKKGRGKLLVNHIIETYHNYPIYLTARYVSLVAYYEKLGFVLIETDKKNHYPMIKQ